MTERSSFAPGPRMRWEHIHREKPLDAVSWYRPHLDTSLRFIAQFAAAPSMAILDVGGGRSTLVDDLLARGYANLTVLDISAAALDAARARLGEAATAVRWLCADITEAELPPASFDLWHDRAAFHFLTAPRHRAAYADQLRRALRPGGHAVIATFALEGPPDCSGLQVARYDAASLAREFGSSFRLVESAEEQHRTPSGTIQPFVYACFAVR